jgi:lipopolysaccharide exporter
MSDDESADLVADARPDDASAEENTLGEQVGRSAMWSAMNAGVLRLATFVISLVVAHLVAPKEFGLFTVALTVFTIAISVSELGVVSAIVREPKRTAEIAPSVFTISLITSGLLTLLLVVFAKPIARELGDVHAAGAVRVLSLVVLLAGFSQVPAALLSRDFMQRQRFMVDAAFFVSSTAVMLALVFVGDDVQALVWSRVAGQLVTVVLIAWMAPERYLPGFTWREVKRLLAFGLPLAGANLITLAIGNVDFIIVGRTLGVTSLGYYNLAFNISGWPVSIFSAVLISVTLPTLSRVRDSSAELVKHLSAGLSAVTAASFPVCALFVALAPQLIDTVYGRRWHPAWVALVVLAIFGAVRTVLTLFSDLVIALGLTRRLLLIQLIWLALLTPAMIFGVRRWGIAGAGIAHVAVVVLVVIPIYLTVVRRGTSVSLGWMSSSLIVPLVASVMAGLAAWGVAEVVEPEVVQLLLGGTAGLAVYVLVAWRWLYKLRTRLRSMYWTRGRTNDDPSNPAQTPLEDDGSMRHSAVPYLPESAFEVREITSSGN